jgi:carboxymethylenebutenolidase
MNMKSMIAGVACAVSLCSGMTQEAEGENGVKVQKVMYPNREVMVVANIYTPAEFDAAKKYPAVVVGHPAGGVKEQVAGLYAQKLAEQGFVTIAFDASYQGESGGLPRGLEDPAVRVEDFRCTVDYLCTLPYIDQERIGAMGICGGGGFAVAAAITEHRIKAVAGVSAVDLGRLRREGLGGSLTPQIQQRLTAAAKQRTVEANGGEVQYANYVPNSLDDIPAGAPTMYREGYEYYRTKLAMHPRSTNKYTLTSLDKLMAFDAFKHIELLAPRPLLMIAGSEAESLYFSQDAIDQAKGEKELYVIPGASHMGLYYKPEYVKLVGEKLTEFFKANLSK